jgi:hypothetical protein
MRGALAATALLATALAGRVAAAAECAAPPPPVLSVQRVAGKVERDDRLGVRDLGKLDPSKSIEGEGHARFVFGLTEMETWVDVRLRTYAQPEGSRFCVWPTRVEVTVSPRFVVRVAREARGSSCFFDYVLAHEQHHVAVEESEVERFVGAAEARLAPEVAALRPELLASEAAGNATAARTAGRLRDLVLDLIAQRRPGRLARHRAEVDAPSEKVIDTVCGGYARRLSRDVAAAGSG